MTNENKRNFNQTNQDAISETEIHSDSRQENSEVLNFDNPSYSFVPKGYHEWRQRGPFAICQSCELEHAIYVGMEKILSGIDEQGQPILKKRV